MRRSREAQNSKSRHSIILYNFTQELILHGLETEPKGFGNDVSLAPLAHATNGGKVPVFRQFPLADNGHVTDKIVTPVRRPSSI